MCAQLIHTVWSFCMFIIWCNGSMNAIYTHQFPWWSGSFHPDAFPSPDPYYCKISVWHIRSPKYASKQIGKFWWTMIGGTHLSMLRHFVEKGQYEFENPWGAIKGFEISHTIPFILCRRQLALTPRSLTLLNLVYSSTACFTFHLGFCFIKVLLQSLAPFLPELQTRVTFLSDLSRRFWLLFRPLYIVVEMVLNSISSTFFTLSFLIDFWAPFTPDYIPIVSLAQIRFSSIRVGCSN